MFEILVNIAQGAVAGAIASIGGYLKTKDEPFDAFKMVKTTLLGAVVGGVAGYSGVNTLTVEAMTAYPFVVYGVDALAKIIYNKVVVPVTSTLKKLSAQ